MIITIKIIPFIHQKESILIVEQGSMCEENHGQICNADSNQEQEFNDAEDKLVHCT